tara:strand:- start:154 stop:1599 length:1446 start_codon:yes stop_codon:yes gene_type:complete
MAKNSSGDTVIKDIANQSTSNDLLDWYRDLRNYTTYIRNDSKEPYELDSDCNVLFKALYGPSFITQLIKAYNEHARTYEDIMNGVPAHTEDLFYVIKKFTKDSFAEKEINVQNIIIPNASDLNIAEYVDTQVKYGTYASYRYEVYVYRIVFGSKYHYAFTDDGAMSPIDSLGSMTNLIYPLSGDQASALPATFFAGITAPEPNSGEAIDELKYTAKVQVTIEPSIRLIGDKLLSTPEIKILDSPPVPPFVDIVPFRAVSNKIKILLGGTTDRYRDEPVIILPTDKQFFEDIRKSQNSVDGKVQFSSDDTVASFQIFRLTEEQLRTRDGTPKPRPTKYEEFLLHPTKPTISTGGFGAFDDEILPNKRYYYTFRTIDSHGHVSNPSPVYEVQLIDEAGAVKPIIRTINLEPSENKQPLREFQKYLLLKPSENQIHFSDQENIKSIFSNKGKEKRYKMRLTSKGSGKKIDINFSFSKKDITNET